MFRPGAGALRSGGDLEYRRCACDQYVWLDRRRRAMLRPLRHRRKKAPTFRPGLCVSFKPDAQAQSDFLQKYQSTHSYSPLATRAFASSTLPGGGTMTFSPGCQFSGVATL